MGDRANHDSLGLFSADEVIWKVRDAPLSGVPAIRASHIWILRNEHLGILDGRVKPRAQAFFPFLIPKDRALHLSGSREKIDDGLHQAPFGYDRASPRQIRGRFSPLRNHPNGYRFLFPMRPPRPHQGAPRHCRRGYRPIRGARRARVSSDHRQSFATELSRTNFLRIQAHLQPLVPLIHLSISRYSMLSTSACKLASMMLLLAPTVPHSALPSPDSISTRVLEAVPVAESRIRTL